LKPDFYRRRNSLRIGKELLGKFLVTRIDGALTSGMIVETETYQGPRDKASHAYGGRRTNRTEPMYWEGGFAYIYLCYGVHHLFNVVVHEAGIPHAILVRAVEPVEGIPIMLRRRGLDSITYRLTAGPGAMSQALGITTQLDRTNLAGTRIWIEDRGITLKRSQIIAGPRVGVMYAAEWASLPWRFRVKDNPWTSRVP
jgi:DNA-3-methyladenine glycosylase